MKLRPACSPHQMLRMLADSGGVLRKVATGKRGDYTRLHELVAAGFVVRQYVITDAGRAALACADTELEIVRKAKPKRLVRQASRSPLGFDSDKIKRELDAAQAMHDEAMNGNKDGD